MTNDRIKITLHAHRYCTDTHLHTDGNMHTYRELPHNRLFPKKKLCDISQSLLFEAVKL